MSFDKDTRNLLAKTITACRRRLTEDVADQLRGDFGLHTDGTILALDELTHLSPDQTAAARRLRDLLDHYTVGAAGKESDRRRAAYERMVLEISFTILNRLAALRLCEERGLVIECVRKGTASDGFRLFERISGGALGGRYDTYKVFLESLFDEFALDLGVLFDRMTPQSAVFPSERCMEDVLAELNKPELTHLWSEDETIGWVYQYFYSDDDRNKAGRGKRPPLNSFELAVRNQFFTPRYVVEFLTDNTLGCIWYEMRKGDTALRDDCRYLVKRSSEIFLTPGDKAPAMEENEADFTQDELLKKPVHIEHRAKKDPRELRVLDPACGSGHFLLYAFDLLERIYEEAWEDPESPKSEFTGRTLRDEFETLENLKRDMPRLIIEHNLHGIDIDPRAVQVAALALWLRAQKTWKNLGIKAAGRPTVAKSNIVTAEPMPGEEDMRHEFSAGLKPRVLGQLVDVVFDKMKLAGEAGSLLKVEEEIKEAVTVAKKQWLENPKLDQQLLFPGMADPRPKQQELRFDLKGITDERFWEQAEDRILEALKEYAERAENGHMIRRQLFAEDAARGFAFIDLCRKRYDVVLMNPPFGSATHGTKAWFRSKYPTAGENLSVGTIQQSLRRLTDDGMVGLIGDLPWLQQSEYAKFRKALLKKESLKLFGELGWGILGTDVEVAVAIFTRKKNLTTIFANIVGVENQAHELISVYKNPKQHIIRHLRAFSVIENCPFAYQISKILLDSFKKRLFLSRTLFEGYGGVAASESNRVFRCWWEVESKKIGYNQPWAFCQNGTPYSPLYYPTYFVIRSDAGKFTNVKSYPNARTPNSEKYWMPGLAYGKRTGDMYTYPLPAEQVITWEGQALFPVSMLHSWQSLALTNSSLYSRLSNLVAGQHKYAGYLNTICFDTSQLKDMKEHAISGYQSIRKIDELNELSHAFTPFILANGFLKRTLDRIVTQAEDNATAQLGAIDEAVCASASEPLYRERRPPSGGSYLSAITDLAPSPITYVKFVVSFLFGCVFGRWDVRLAMDPSLAPNLADPFDPLPVCPPGMLVSPNGVPAESGRIASEEWLRSRPDTHTLTPEGLGYLTIPDDDYPLSVSWDGILVDDPGGINGWSINGTPHPHRDDIVRRLHEVLDLLWKDKALEIEQEVCDILSVSGLRDYFRRPGGFFQDHLKRYSKSRRKAPIYWPLSTASGSYTLWFYYHRLTDQTLYGTVNRYVEPKIAEVERCLPRIEDKLRAVSGREATLLRDRLNETQTFLGELRDLREELLRIATLPYKPNLNDGVIINAAPFHSLFRLRSWANDTENVWGKLENGDYDWAHLAYIIWPDQVREACKKDRSIAIAHGLEDICEVEVTPTKKRAKKRKKS